MKNRFSKISAKHVKAFTLTEVLVVLIIIGILILLALPNLLPLITRAKSTEAKIQLQHAFTLEKNYFFEHSCYTSSLEDISFEQQPLSTNGGQANYRIEITEASAGTFRITATAVADFDGDGVFNVWEIDQNKSLRESVQD